MGAELDTISGWFVLNAGFKVYGRCPHCQSPNISFYKERRTGLKGISSVSKGITPVCLDCGHSLPTQQKKAEKQTPISKKQKNTVV